VRRSPKLYEIFHHKCVPTKETNPLTIWKLIFNRLAVVEYRELKVVGCEPRPDAAYGRIDANISNRSRHAERKKTGGSEHSGGLRNGVLRNREDRCSVITEHDIECLVSEGQVLRVALHKGNGGGN